MRLEEGLRFRYDGQAYQVVAFHRPGDELEEGPRGILLHSVPIETDEELPELVREQPAGLREDWLKTLEGVLERALAEECGGSTLDLVEDALVMVRSTPLSEGEKSEARSPRTPIPETKPPEGRDSRPARNADYNDPMRD